jgi:hypothetical protein
VSCTVEFSGPYDGNYALEVRNTQGTTCNGTVVDPVTRLQIILPVVTKGITSRRAGFVGYYAWNSGTPHRCAPFPYTSLKFGIPTTSAGGSAGSLGSAHDFMSTEGELCRAS